jgi:DNA-binding NarL/FixJ family response regulator
MAVSLPLKCFIAEDSAFMREIYNYSLRDVQNFQIVAEACDGVEALRLIAEVQPDILILDLVLPLKNGLDVLKEMSTISPHTKIIVISSLDDEATQAKAKALGAIAYLHKPFTKAALIQAVEDISNPYLEVQNG